MFLFKKFLIYRILIHILANATFKQKNGKKVPLFDATLLDQVLILANINLHFIHNSDHGYAYYRNGNRRNYTN